MAQSNKSNKKAANQKNDQLDKLIASHNDLRKQIADWESKENDPTAAILLPNLRNALRDLDTQIVVVQGESTITAMKSYVEDMIKEVPMPLPTFFLVKIDEDGVSVERTGRIKPSKTGGTKTRTQYNSTATTNDLRMLIDTISVLMGYKNANKMAKLHILGCLASLGKTTHPDVGSAIGYLHARSVTSPLYGEIGTKGGQTMAVGKALFAYSKDDKKVAIAVERFSALFAQQMKDENIIKGKAKATKEDCIAFIRSHEKDADKAKATPVV